MKSLVGPAIFLVGAVGVVMIYAAFMTKGQIP